jgi:hypothetical protein
MILGRAPGRLWGPPPASFIGHLEEEPPRQKALRSPLAHGPSHEVAQIAKGESRVFPRDLHLPRAIVTNEDASPRDETGGIRLVVAVAQAHDPLPDWRRFPVAHLG